jgi:tetratricopeptide (TPR) repeat protein
VGQRKTIEIVVAVIVVIIVAFAVWYVTSKPTTDTATENAEVKTLQTSLDTATNNGDSPSVINVSSQLISGAKSGNFTLSKGDLAQYYLERASAYLNMGQYAQAAEDSESAVKADGSVKLASLQVEFEARYKEGDRSQLIPILQQIVQLEKTSGNPRWGAAAEQYQEDIQSIQQDQEIDI